MAHITFITAHFKFSTTHLCSVKGLILGLYKRSDKLNYN